MSYLVNPYMVSASGGASQLYGTHGYNIGGSRSGLAGAKIIQYEIGTSTEATEVCDLSKPRKRGGNAQTVTDIYTMGGDLYGTSTITADIEDYEIGVTTTATSISDLDTGVTTNGCKGMSETHAFNLGGGTGGWGFTDQIQSYEMGSGTVASDVANLDTGVFGLSGGTNLVYSYAYVGFSGGRQSWIQEFENGTTTTATTVADAVTARYGMLASTQTSTHIVGWGGDA